MKKIILFILLSVFIIACTDNSELFKEDTNNSESFKEYTNEGNNSLNRDGDKVKYSDKEIYFQKGRQDPEKKVFYSEYDLIVYDSINKQEEIIANTFNRNAAMYDGKLYYFVSNFDDKEQKFYSYNLDTKEIEDLKLPHKMGIYDVVAYNNKVYFGVHDSPRYGIFEYDIKTRQYKKFSDLDIRYLHENFLFVNDGFLTAKNNILLHLDLSGNSKIKYPLNGQYMEKSFGAGVIMTEPNVICLDVCAVVSRGTAEGIMGGSYVGTVGKIYLDISQNYKVIKTEVIDEKYW
jgi:hypothetical protein